jgi:hypothetical protein
VGFFSRLFIPRSARRAVHPGRAVKRAVTPKVVKKASRAMHPIDNAAYSVQRSVATTIRSDGKAQGSRFPAWKLPSQPSQRRSGSTVQESMKNHSR